MGVRKGAGERADGELMGNGWGLAHIRLVCLLQAVERLHLAPVGGRPAVVEVECGVGVSECLGEAAELDPHESAVGEVEGPPRRVETAARQHVEQLAVALLRRRKVVGLGVLVGPVDERHGPQLRLVGGRWAGGTSGSQAWGCAGECVWVRTGSEGVHLGLRKRVRGCGRRLGLPAVLRPGEGSARSRQACRWLLRPLPCLRRLSCGLLRSRGGRVRRLEVFLPRLLERVALCMGRAGVDAVLAPRCRLAHLDGPARRQVQVGRDWQHHIRGRVCFALWRWDSGRR